MEVVVAVVHYWPDTPFCFRDLFGFFVFLFDQRLIGYFPDRKSRVHIWKSFYVAGLMPNSALETSFCCFVLLFH